MTGADSINRAHGVRSATDPKNRGASFARWAMDEHDA